VPLVLVVDDELPLRLLYRVNLEAEGFEVVEAVNGLSGLAAAREASPDIILLDVMMPGLDGWGVADQLRDDPVTRNTPVVFVTPRCQPRDRLRGFELGAADYIGLPTNPMKLAPRIHAVLARNRDELDAVRREKIAELNEWIRREDSARMRLRDLIEQHAGDVFGGDVMGVSDWRETQAVVIWLDRGGSWRIGVQPELDAFPLGKIAELNESIWREHSVRMWLHDLIERHAGDVFGSGVKKVLDTGGWQALHIWLDDGSEWRISIEPPNQTIF
jgi:CheY-like chemotaxis protein